MSWKNDKSLLGMLQLNPLLRLQAAQFCLNFELTLDIDLKNRASIETKNLPNS